MLGKIAILGEESKPQRKEIVRETIYLDPKTRAKIRIYSETRQKRVSKLLTEMVLQQLSVLEGTLDKNYVERVNAELDKQYAAM